jgi:hypothetical protein
MAATIIEDDTLEMRWRRLARQHGRAIRAGGFLQLSMSQEELGKYLGATRANVNRQLSELKTAKFDHDQRDRDHHCRRTGPEEIALNPPPDERPLER